MDDDNISTFNVDANSGGYLLSAKIDGKQEVELTNGVSGPSEGPGSVSAKLDGVSLMSIGGVSGDGRVLIKAHWTKKPLTALSIAQRSEAFRVVRTFQIAAPMPVSVMSASATFQGLLIPRPGNFTCSVFMRIDEKPLDPGDPLEVHSYFIAPTRFSEDSFGWWCR